MVPLSLITLETIAWLKIILIGFVLCFFILLAAKKQKALFYTVLMTVFIFVFYLIFSYKFRTMLWGNNGDEFFIMAFLSRVLHGQPLTDFYYSWLPTFYPPLYFWVTGLISSLFTQSAIVAHKIGVLGSLFLWFSGSYLYQWIYFKKINHDQKGIAANSWFWLIFPLMFFIILDFDSIVLKPYETLAAMLVILFLSLLTKSFKQDKWNIKTYLFFGISAGILFLIYYFWWFLLVPAILIVILMSNQKIKNLLRTIWVGLIALIMSAIYLIPLVGSFFKYGTENWQALFFIDQDFSTFVPWSVLSLKTLILILGLAGFVIFRKRKSIQPVITIFLVCYLYQLVNYVYFIFFKTTFQPAKAFLFLASGCLIFSAAYLLICVWQKYVLNKLNSFQQRSLVAIIFLVYLPFIPAVKFIDEPAIRWQMEKNLKEPESVWLAEQIKKNMPDWQDRTWLSSGTPVVNAYLPLSYFIAHNPHFSHQAAQYSQKMEFVEKLTQADDADIFWQLIKQSNPPIDSLIFYFNTEKQSYDLFFWEDNYPNGGQEKTISLSKELISDKYWDLVFDQNNWNIFLIKE